MITNEKTIKNYLSELGFDNDIADLYLTLYQYGPQTLSALARNSGVERTRIYRLLDKLKDSSLIEVEVRYKRNIYKAAPISNLRLIIASQEQRLKNLQTELTTIEQLLPHNTMVSPTTKVQFYQGEESVRQMLWNQTKAKTDVLAILHDNMQRNTGATFFQRWVEACNQKGQLHRGIFNDTFLSSQKKWYGTSHKRQLQNWQGRYISPDILPITHSQIVYDNVVTFYNWKDNEVFGIEIYSKQIAQAHRYFFKAYWQLAEPLQARSPDSEDAG